MAGFDRFRQVSTSLTRHRGSRGSRGGGRALVESTNYKLKAAFSATVGEECGAGALNTTEKLKKAKRDSTRIRN